MSFSGDVNKFIKKTERKALLIFKKVGFDMYANIVRLTPVDTGRAKGNWLMTVNKMMKTEIEEGAMTQDAIAATARSILKLGDRLYIINNLPYIKKLEDGSSTQAPAGMVKIEVAQFKHRVNQAVKAKFNG